MKKTVFSLLLTFCNGCLISDGEPDDLDVASMTQALQTCTATCDAPTWNGVPVSCSSSIYCVAHATGVYCDTGQTPITKTCSTCGNGTCQAGESPSSCPGDCGCGNGICDADESPCGCAGDCSVCGDNICDELEMDGGCPSDCHFSNPWCF